MGYMVRIDNNIIDTRTIQEKRMIPVMQLDLHGHIIACFPSIAEAQRKTNILHISECINHIRRTAGGYIWQSMEDKNE